MSNPLKPIKLTISQIKDIVGNVKTPKDDGGDDPETFFTEDELETLRKAARADYESLSKVLGLKPVPLDIYCPSQKSTARTRLKTPTENCTPLYDSHIIVLPVIPGTIIHGVELKFPPTSWDVLNPVWPRWRLDLWHETLHQVEHDIFNSWTGGEKHGPSYMQAIEYAASKLRELKEVSFEQLRLLTLGG